VTRVIPWLGWGWTVWLALGLAVPLAANARGGTDAMQSACPGGTTMPGVIHADTFDVASLNIGHGRGMALNQMFVSRGRHEENLDAIAKTLRATGAAVVALQEADAPSLWSGRFDHVEYLAAAMDYRCFVHGPHAEAWLYSFGTALVSRVSMADTGSHGFEPSPPTTTKGFVHANVEWQRTGDGAPIEVITLISIHLDFSRKQVRDAQIAELVEVMSGREHPVVILGDFNEDWSLDSSAVRRIAAEFGLRAFTPDAEDLGTYKQTERLDWILISEELEFVDYTVLPDLVSDHRGLIARIGWASTR
jgi:endonuclease/exonuclease/phosphatase family metal-dependent hydrolase